MIELRKTFGENKLFVLIFVFLIAADVAIVLNIPFLRQIFGFLFLTILPGVLILQILKLNKIGSTEKFVLAVGLSISFLMLFGLLINNLSLRLGYETPLATIPVLISFNLALIVFAIIGYNVNKEPVVSIPDLNLRTSEKAFLIVPILFPALSIFGMNVMNTTDNSIILMFLLFLIPVYVISLCIFNQKVTKRTYPIVIFLISISLLLLMALRSNHLLGVDTHLEYYFFQTTLDNLHWRVGIMGNALEACLSISLLPTIYQSILNIPPEFLFKILYSILFSVSPLVIYVLSKKYVGEFYGFLTSCSFMFLQNFLWTPLHARTNIAILFVALMMMVIFSDRIDPLKKKMLFIVFMASTLVSHYSTTYILLFILLGTFIGVETLSKKYTVKKDLTLTIVIIFFTLIFFWYSQVTEVAFNSGVRFIEATLTNLNNFFMEETRSGGTRAMLGEGIWQKGIPNQIEFVLTWLTFSLIGMGVLTLIRRYKEMSFPEHNFKKPDFLKEKFEVEYFVLTLAISGLFIMIVALPYITVGYSLDRTYLLGVTILSVFFVIGGVTLSKYVKIRAYLIILLVLIPYFLCVTGVMYNIFGAPQAVILNSEGDQYDKYYVHDQESCGAKWIKGSAKEENLKVYADKKGMLILTSQGPMIFHKNARIITKPRAVKDYIYLGYLNVNNDTLYTKYNTSMEYEYHDITEYLIMFIGKNNIYDNGGSKIWQ